PMGSERTEVRKRQMATAPETPGAAQAQLSTGNRGSNACCFCWCCCCSCSCLTVRNQEEERARRTSHELQAEGIPNCEERYGLYYICCMEPLYSRTCGSHQFTLLFNSNLIKQQLPRLHCPPASYSYSKFSLFTTALTLQEMNCHKKLMLSTTGQEHTFDDAQLQIYTLMHRDSYPRFMNSAIYKDLLQSLSEKSIEA
ncbi:RGS20 protein, partial [Cinclus mexicanus]|nr:RGS20 protein [Cinclus mexicanus]